MNRAADMRHKVHRLGVCDNAFTDPHPIPYPLNENSVQVIAHHYGGSEDCYIIWICRDCFDRQLWGVRPDEPPGGDKQCRACYLKMPLPGIRR